MSAPTATTREHRSLPHLPRGTGLDEAEWRRRHRLLLGILGLHVPALAAFGLLTDRGPVAVGVAIAVVAALTLAAALQPRRRPASVLVVAGLASCSTILTIFADGSAEASVHVVVVLGLVALYQDWVPFLLDVGLAGILQVGATLVPALMSRGPGHPWLWTSTHVVGLLAACGGVLLAWRFSEDVQDQRTDLIARLARAENERREFTSDLLLTTARRHQGMVQRQLDIVHALEEREHDHAARADLVRLDHLATRMRRGAESLLVLSGDHPGRVGPAPVPLRDVVHAAVAETEALERVAVTVDGGLSLVGGAVADLTHLLAELTENALRHSAPAGPVSIASRPYHPAPGAHLILVEDTGVGMPADELTTANGLLASPGEVDVGTARRLGLHVVARLAARHHVGVSLTPTPGCGLTAVVIVPATLFVREDTRAPSPGPRRDAPLPPVNGRHSWLGHDPAGQAPPVVEEPTAADDPPRRRALIHPLAVPPPPDPDDDPPPPEEALEIPAVEAPAPRTSEESEAPTLSRRVPQTHLAPGLARTTPPPEGNALSGDAAPSRR